MISFYPHKLTTMKKKYSFCFLALSLIGSLLVAQTNASLMEMAQEKSFDKGKVHYIQLKENYTIYENTVEAFLNTIVLNDNHLAVKKIRTDKDELGYSHSRYEIRYNNVPVHNAVIVTHAIGGKIASINGDLSSIQKPSNSVVLNEQNALQKALNKVNAKKYKWENKEEENHMKEALNDPNFTYSPNGQLVLYSINSKVVYAYKFCIYAEEPLYKANVIVDAQNGKILQEENMICHADVPATANTKYSGVKSFTVDNVAASSYRLRETGRGNGIRTYNLNNGSNYGAATDFTNTSTSWTTTGVDQAATDAHWGAEMTYDYYMLNHNRNSIDGAGYNLLSYVHYNTNYQNAFWDGTRMTYGDGGGSYTIFTALDVCGHEITHGLTSNTSNLNYSNESGALNESYSDIFGNSIENYARPSQWSWKMGEDMTVSGNGLRNMSNPALFSDPDTYNGTYWYTGTADNGGVHTNSGVSNFWYYLLVAGGTGTNDISNSYTVNAIGWTAASRIAFRALTVYYTPTTNYATARNLSIQAAKDLYGNCSNEVVQVTNAWYAVGVGPAYSNSISPNFTASGTSFCSVPVTINFNNTTASGITYSWNFGDGSAVSTATNPAHTYTANGTYSVKLKATGCLSAIDSITKVAYITINTPANPVTTGASRCGTGTVNLTASGSSQLYWYTTPTGTGTPVNIGGNYTTPTLTANTTYYVINTSTNAPVVGAPSSTAIGTSANYNTATAYDIFDVIQPSTLKSVIMYASTAGNRTVELRNSSNTVITSTIVNLAIGANTVNLNFALTPGTNYRLGLNSASAVNLYRNSTGAVYPYNIGGLVNITGSSAGTPGYFYFFYNWQIQKANCVSAAVAVTASVSPGPPLTVNSPTICNGQTASLIAGGATTYSWSSGQTTSSISVNPLATSNYTLYGTASSCTGSLITTVVVNPNPTVTVTSPSVCIGQSTNITAGGATSYSWSSGQTGSVIAVTPSSNSTYTVTGYTGSCSSANVASVTVLTLPTISVNSPTICTGQSATLIANGASSYTFNPGGITGNPIAVTPSTNVTYTVSGSNGNCSNTAVSNVVVNLCLGLGEAFTNATTIAVYPNPATDYLTVIHPSVSISAEIRVYDANGKLAISKKVISQEETIDISKLAKGIYFVEITNHSERIFNTKIIKQ